MNFVSLIMVVFSMLAAIDRIIGGRFRLAKEFERGFMLFGTMALSMIGMIIISPFIAELLEPVFGFVYDTFSIDPSIIPASLFANDMGGAPLSQQVAKNAELGLFNALVVSSMMGCTVSFTIPFALGVVNEKYHKELLLGLLCGVVTIPIGCFVGGVVCGLPLAANLLNLLPLAIFSGAIALGLLFCPNMCVRIFGVLGRFINILITIGLALGILKFLTGLEPIKGLESIEYGGAVCLNASIVMSGAFPLMYIVSRILQKPLKKLGELLGVSEISAMGFVSSLATSVTTYSNMERMDRKGIVMNSAFCVSGAFTFAGHLAFTLAFDAAYLPGMIAGKLVAGLTSVVLAAIIFRRTEKAE